MATDAALLVGDTHADTPFLLAALRTAQHLGLPTVIQLGDFGYWPHADSFLRLARTARETYGVDVWFIDGNHENFYDLSAHVSKARPLGADPRSPVELAPGFVYLPRGSRIRVAGQRVLCVGGATSVDRTLRTPGIDWFIEERLSDADIDAAIAGGPADILLSHDAPAGWTIPGLPMLPASWLAELPAAHEHRRRLAEVFEAVLPSIVVHGHYHVAYAAEIERPWGPVRVYGLAHNGQHLWGARILTVDGIVHVDPVIGAPSPVGYRGELLG